MVTIGALLAAAEARFDAAVRGKRQAMATCPADVWMNNDVESVLAPYHLSSPEATSSPFRLLMPSAGGWNRAGRDWA
jgi:hypothetical protein